MPRPGGLRHPPVHLIDEIPLNIRREVLKSLGEIPADRKIAGYTITSLHTEGAFPEESPFKPNARYAPCLFALSSIAAPWTTVTRLRNSGSPLQVSRLVVAVVVNAVQRASVGAGTEVLLDVGDERPCVISPAIPDANAASTVPAVVVGLRIITSFLDPEPELIEGVFTPPVRVFPARSSN
jgi:hypothetical protein